MQLKREIRREALNKRKNLSFEHKKEYSHLIIEKLIKSREFQEADTILCYVSTEDEVDTRELMHIAWNKGKRIEVPKVVGKHEMEFFEIRSFSDLREGYRGILEPEEGEILSDKKALVIVPGVAFDRFGKRIGYGGGFYDTYLQKHPEYAKAAFAFSVQMTEKIPAEPHDVSMDYIYTEKGVYRRW